MSHIDAVQAIRLASVNGTTRMPHDPAWLHYAELAGYVAAGIMLTGLVVLAVASAAYDLLW
jgi:hypothetical protein